MGFYPEPSQELTQGILHRTFFFIFQRFYLEPTRYEEPLSKEFFEYIRIRVDSFFQKWFLIKPLLLQKELLTNPFFKKSFLQKQMVLCRTSALWNLCFLRVHTGLNCLGCWLNVAARNSSGTALGWEITRRVSVVWSPAGSDNPLHQPQEHIARRCKSKSWNVSEPTTNHVVRSDSQINFWPSCLLGWNTARSLSRCRLIIAALMHVCSGRLAKKATWDTFTPQTMGSFQEGYKFK